MRRRFSRYGRVAILLLIVLALPVGIFVTTRGIIDRENDDRELPVDLVLAPDELPAGATEARQLVIPTGSATSFVTSSGVRASCFVLVAPGGEPVEDQRFEAVAEESVNPLTEGLALAARPVTFEPRATAATVGDQAVAFESAPGSPAGAGLIWREGYATAGCFTGGARSAELDELIALQQEKLVATVR